MVWLIKILLLELAQTIAPLVCLVYRRGLFLTPDDTTSPFGRHEPTMARIYARFGTFIGDWWWLGVRNRAYGLAFRLKPDFFRHLHTYRGLAISQRRWKGPLRIIEIHGYFEFTLSCRYFHVICGYRLRPIVDWILDGTQPYRAVNMDARPIFSIRLGARDE